MCSRLSRPTDMGLLREKKPLNSERVGRIVTVANNEFLAQIPGERSNRECTFHARLPGILY
jgi:hypothetical protein